MVRFRFGEGNSERNLPARIFCADRTKAFTRLSSSFPSTHRLDVSRQYASQQGTHSTSASSERSSQGNPSSFVLSLHLKLRLPPRHPSRAPSQTRPTTCATSVHRLQLKRNSFQDFEGKSATEVGKSMSFNFEWPEFSEAFYQDAREMLAQVRIPLVSLDSDQES